MPSIFQTIQQDSVDLCDELSSFSSSAKVKLDELSKILGFAGKPKVESFFRAGRIAEIAAYCETDVVNTFRVWLRHELFCGRLTLAAYDYSGQSLARYVDAHALLKPHLTRWRNLAVFNNGWPRTQG